MSAPDRPGEAASDGLMVPVFSVLWALAGIWHVLGNSALGSWWTQGLVVGAAGVVLLVPGAPLALGALALAELAHVWDEAPTIGNHWVLAGFVNLAIVGGVVLGVLRGRAGNRDDLAQRVLPAARLCLLGFYAFAGFAKLNSAFFDREVSCATFYFRESTDSLGLQGLQLGGATWVEHLVIVGTVVIELGIPVLLVVRRTRSVGVLVALVFHGGLALDRSHQFFDFSSLLAALFVAFLPAVFGGWVEERVGSARARLALRDERLPGRIHLLLVAAPVAAGLLVVASSLTADQAVEVGWWPWQAMSLVLIAGVARFLRQSVGGAQPVRLRPHRAVFAVVPLLVVLNGLTPYLEVKTGYGWNMYSNLRTVDGETNHLIVPATFPLADEQADVVEIVRTDDRGLARYAATDYGLTWRQLRSYLSAHPEVAITYRRSGELVELERAADDPELVRPVPAWREKLQLFRAVDLEAPERCVPTFGPAR